MSRKRRVQGPKAVYEIYNYSKDRIYIGSTKYPEERRKTHFNCLSKNKHCNPYMQNDFNKCGEESFIFSIIELLPSETSKEQLLEREQFWLDKHYDKQQICYNINPKAHSSDGRVCSDATKKKISETNKGMRISEGTMARLLKKDLNPFAKSGKDHPKSSKPMPETAKKTIKEKLTGKKKTQEHNENNRKSQLRRVRTEEEKLKWDKNRSHPAPKKILQFEMDGFSLIKEWDSMKSVVEKLKIPYSSISQCCHGRSKSCRGFVWRLA